MTYFYKLCEDLFFPGRVYNLYDKNHSIDPRQYFASRNVAWWLARDENGTIEKTSDVNNDQEP
jgi:hypothetical protein